MVSYDIVMETELRAHGATSWKRKKNRVQPHLLTPGNEIDKLACRSL